MIGLFLLILSMALSFRLATWVCGPDVGLLVWAAGFLIWVIGVIFFAQRAGRRSS